MRKTLFDIVREQAQNEEPVIDSKALDIKTVIMDDSEMKYSFNKDGIMNFDIKKIPDPLDHVRKLVSNLPTHPDKIKTIGLKNKGNQSKKTTEEQLKIYTTKLESILKSIKEYVEGS